MKTALILVDLQNDFMPGGALAVRDGDQVVPIANELLKSKPRNFALVVATRDFHPADHGSFAVNNPGQAPGQMGELGGIPQVMWPVHCVQGSVGSEFSSHLETQSIDRIFPKGTDKRVDSYSGFFDNDQKSSTGLGEFLKEQKIEKVVVMGLATDYCVKFTALDAARIGFKTVLISDGCRAVNLKSDDGLNAVREMKAAGVEIKAAKDFLKENRG